MADTDNPDAPMISPPRAARFGEGPEGKAARRERGHAASQGGPGRLAQFLHDVRAELKRVSWPSAVHVKNTTIITLIAVAFFAFYLFLVDRGMVYLIKGLEWLIARIAGLLGLA
jgi:preprotein translocase SecE subunit